jgi:DnaJ-class molecular chaperone
MAAEGKVLVDGRWVNKDEAAAGGAPGGAAKTGGSGGAKPSGNTVTAVTGEAFSGESKWEKCSKCGGSGILVTRDCMQCEGKGYNYLGAGLAFCQVCRGTGKWLLQCPYCGGTGRTTRGRWADPVFPKVKLPNDGWQHCPKCSGTGVLTSITCAQCDGKGYIDLKESLMLCNRCGGYGKIPQRCFFCDGKGMFRK